MKREVIHPVPVGTLIDVEFRGAQSIAVVAAYNENADAYRCLWYVAFEMAKAGRALAADDWFWVPVDDVIGVNAERVEDVPEEIPVSDEVLRESMDWRQRVPTENNS